MKNSQPIKKNSKIPVMISDAFSFKPNWEAIWMDPCCINTRNADTKIIANGLNFDIHATMMAVNPRPPAVLVEIVWLAPLTIRQPAIPQIAPGEHHRADDYFFYINTGIARSILALADNCDLISLFAVFHVYIHARV